MPPDSKVSVRSFVRDCKGQMIPVNKFLSYFSVIPLEGGELQRLIYDPAAALPPQLQKTLPSIGVVLAAYLEENPQDAADPLVAFRAPAHTKRMFSAVTVEGGTTYLFIATKGEEIADTHDTLYYEIAKLLVERADDRLLEGFYSVIRDELRSEVHGELEDEGWKLKEQLRRKQTDIARETKLFRTYADQALIDTLTLYLHGLCCDIDVEAGPRQLTSRAIRRRLEALRGLLPPPDGVALFPEELRQPA